MMYNIVHIYTAFKVTDNKDQDSQNSLLSQICTEPFCEASPII